LLKIGDSNEKRKKYSGEQKAVILRELLENNIQVSQLAEKYGVNPIDIYNWKKKLFEGTNEILTFKPDRKGNVNNETKRERARVVLDSSKLI